MKVESFPGMEALSRRAAALFMELSEKAIARRGRFSVALSGGSTPEMLYALLGSEYKDKIKWEQTDVFFADERCVPPGHADSNFRLAHEAFLSKVPAKIHRIKGESDPEEAAVEYEREIKEGDYAPFDLILLGMGEDGHTASLFPGSAALKETVHLVVPVYAGSLRRVTLTLPAINGARDVVFLVSGGGSKRETLRRILGGEGDYPASYVRPESGNLLWLVDEGAGG